MFSSLTKALVKDLGCPGNMISNSDYNQDWPLLTLVKIKSIRFAKFRGNKKYKLTKTKLTNLTDDLSLEPKTEVYLENFEHLRHVGVGLSLAGGNDEGQGKIGANQDIVDRSTPVTLMKEYIITDDLHKLFGKQISMDQKYVDALKMKKGDKLAFVVQRVYNKNKVQVLSAASRSGSLGIKAFSFVDFSLEGNLSVKTSMKLPENKTFAVVLQDIYPRENNLLFCFLMSPEETITLVSMMISELEEKTNVWESLAGCSRLLPSLTEILEDGYALSQLEDALDQIIDEEYQPSEPGLVASFMDLLGVSTASKELIEALHLLVSALEALPENVSAALAKCDLETLDGIMGIMEHLKTDDPLIPESMLSPLDGKEELNWVGSFLRSGSYGKNHSTDDDDPSGANLEALYISVRGLRLMQP